MDVRILGLDIAGNPFKWLSMEEAIHYYASDKVVWELGDDIATFHGGTQRKTGDRSVIVAKSILLYRDWETDRKSTRLNSSHRL